MEKKGKNILWELKLILKACTPSQGQLITFKIRNQLNLGLLLVKLELLKDKDLEEMKFLDQILINLNYKMNQVRIYPLEKKEEVNNIIMIHQDQEHIY